MAIFVMETPWPEGGSPAHENILIKWVRENPTLRLCALDVLDRSTGERQYVWLSSFLWDVLYGAGFPYAHDTRRQLIADYLKTNYASMDFGRITRALKGG